MAAVAVAVLALVVAACFSDPVAVLDEHGWTAHEPLGQERVVIGIFDTRTWRGNLAASRDVGMDFGPWWGRDAHLMTYDVGPATGYVLVGDGTPIGAWLVADDGRVLPLDSTDLERPSG